jgi:hypothetical protein
MDQVATVLPRGPEKAETTLVFNRLLMAARLPDSSFVLVVVIDGARDLMIKGVDVSILESMPEDVIVDF